MTDAIWKDYVPQKFHLTLVETTLLQFYIETVFTKPFQSLSNVYIMLLQSFWVDQDIIQVYYDENIEEISKNVIRHMLKNCLCIRKTEWHHFILKMAIVSMESNLPFIPRTNSNKVVSTPKI